MLAKFLLTTFVLRAGAETVAVAIGRNGFTFTPNTIQAAEGDVVEFRFWARNHSVVRGNWSKACVPDSDGGFFSGFFPTAEGGPNDNVFRVTLNNTDPIVVYCSQNTGAHCKNGMVAVINPEGSSNLDNYLTLAKNASSAVSPPSVFGGVIAQLPKTTSAGRPTTSIRTSTSTRITTATASSATASASSTSAANAAGGQGGSFAAAAAGVVALLVF